MRFDRFWCDFASAFKLLSRNCTNQRLNRLRLLINMPGRRDIYPVRVYCATYATGSRLKCQCQVLSAETHTLRNLLCAMLSLEAPHKHFICSWAKISSLASSLKVLQEDQVIPV